MLRFEPKPGAAAPAIGTYIYTYRASAVGTQKLRFVYVSPGGPTPVNRDATALLQVLKVTIQVEAAPAP